MARADARVTDLLATADGSHGGVRRFVFRRAETAARPGVHTHGTGCTLATAPTIAGGAVLAPAGTTLPGQAVRRARDYVQAAIAERRPPSWHRRRARTRTLGHLVQGQALKTGVVWPARRTTVRLPPDHRRTTVGPRPPPGHGLTMPSTRSPPRAEEPHVCRHRVDTRVKPWQDGPRASVRPVATVPPPSWHGLTCGSPPSAERASRTCAGNAWKPGSSPAMWPRPPGRPIPRLP